MSAASRLEPLHAVMGPHGRSARHQMSSTLGWWMVAGFLATVQAAAVYLDFKLGIAVTAALAGAAVVLMRPALLVPIALLTVYLEGAIVNGVAITRFFAPLAFLLVLGELLRRGARIRADLPLAWSGAYVLWAMASGLWTVSGEGTVFLLQSLAIALVFMLLFASLLNTERDLRRFAHVFAATAGFMGAISLFAFATSTETLLGFELLQAGRSQGLVGDPDFFAAMQLVALPLVLVLLSETRNHRVRLSLTVVLFALLGSVFTSLSRGAFLALLVLSLLLVASRPEKLFQSRRQKAVTLLVASLGMVVFFSRPYAREQVTTRAESIYAPKDRDEASGAGRTNLWKAAASTAAAHPVTGIGYGSFRYVSEDLLLRTPGVDPLLLQNRDEGDNFAAHSAYFGTAAELGWTGLLILAGLIVSTAALFRRTAIRARAAGAHFLGRISHALMLGVIAWAATAIFLSAETSRMTWILVGLSLALPKLLPTRAAPDQPLS